MECSVVGCGGEARTRGWCAMHYGRVKRGRPVGGAAKLKDPNSRMPWLRSLIKHKGKDCVYWPFPIHSRGYGRVDTLEFPNTPASRVMCILAHGPPPTPSHQAAHSCGRGFQGCMNPNHLSWKTAKENGEDKVLHGVSGRGTKNPQAKLNEGQVLDIKRRLKSGDRGIGRKLSTEYGVCPSQISMIKKGIKWGWLSANGGKGE